MTTKLIRTGIVLAVALITVLLIAGSGIGGVAGASPSPADAAAYDAAPTDTELDPSIDDSGTVEVLVTLESSANPDATMGPADEISPLAQPVHEFATNRAGVKIHNEFWIADTVLIEIDQNQADIAALAAVQNVKYVGENSDVEPLATASQTTEPVTTPTSTLSPQSVGFETSETDSDTAIEMADQGVEADNNPDVTYGLEQINAPDVWQDFNTQGEGTKIAVLDTGIDADHQDITLFTRDENDPTYPGGWAEFDRYGQPVESTPYDDNGHGTHVSGTVAGGDATGTHIGVAPEADLIHGGVLTPRGGTEAAVLAGIQWGVEENADVISMSLGAGGYHPAMIDAVRTAEDHGSVVVAAIGNSGEGTSGSPGNIYDTFSVGASDEAEQIARFSSGEHIDTDQAWGNAAPREWPDTYVVPSVSAPGVDVVSAIPGNTYSSFDGTSMAAPHVSGSIALMLSHEDRNVDEIKHQLETTAWKPDGAPAERDTRYGDGIIDVYAATALEGDGATIRLSDEVGEPGDSVEVTFDTTAQNVAGYQATVTFDPAVVEATAVTDGDLGETAVNIDNEDGTVALSAAEATGTDEPLLASVEFTIAADAELGHRTSLGFGADTELVTPAGDSVVTSSESGSILVADDPVVLSLSDANGSPGETVTSTLDSEGEFAGYDVTIEFDPAVVQFQSATGVDMAHPAVNVDNANGVVQLGSAEATDVTSPSLADLEFAVVGEQGDRSSLTVDTDATTVVTAAGERLITAQQSGEITVGDQPEEATFVVSDLDPVEAAVGVDEPITISAAVTNVGGADGTQDIDLRLDGESIQTEPGVSVDSGETERVTFDAVEINEPGIYTHGVYSDDGSATGTLTVSDQESGEFIISDLEPEEVTVDPGEAFDVSATVTNIGIEDTQDIELRLDGEAIQTEPDVTLATNGETTVTFEDVTVGASGTYTHGVYSEDDRAIGTLTVGDEMSGLNVTLQPSEEVVAPGGIQAYDIVVANADNGISAFELDVTIADGDVARFDSYVITQAPGFDNTELTNTVLSFEVGMGDNVYEPDDEIVIATVTAQAQGGVGDSTELDISDIEIRNEFNTPYEIGNTAGAELVISEEEALPPVVGEEPPRDLNGDGLYRDIDGDGEFDIFDIQALFDNRNSEAVQNNVEQFDFNGDGGVDIFDVQRLFQDLQQN